MPSHMSQHDVLRIDDRARTHIAAVKHASILPESEKPAERGPLQLSCKLWPVVKVCSGRRGSNPRPRPWQGRTVPYRALTNHHERTEERPIFIELTSFFRHVSSQVI